MRRISKKTKRTLIVTLCCLVTVLFVGAVIAASIGSMGELGSQLGLQSPSHNPLDPAEQTLSPAAMLEPLYVPDPHPVPASNGAVSAILRVPTTQPVVFLTIDDGVYPIQAAIEYLRQQNLKPTLFLNDMYAAKHIDYFSALAGDGATIQNHTINHPLLTKLPYDQQKQQICGNADLLQQQYGKRPTLFRPPYGAYNEDTRKAAFDCGMKALINWSVTASDGQLHYQEGGALRPGDIILTHFQPDLMANLAIIEKQAHLQGLSIAPLAEWIN